MKVSRVLLIAVALVTLLTMTACRDTTVVPENAYFLHDAAAKNLDLPQEKPDAATLAGGHPDDAFPRSDDGIPTDPSAAATVVNPFEGMSEQDMNYAAKDPNVVSANDFPSVSNPADYSTNEYYSVWQENLYSMIGDAGADVEKALGERNDLFSQYMQPDEETGVNAKKPAEKAKAAEKAKTNNEPQQKQHKPSGPSM